MGRVGRVPSQPRACETAATGTLMDFLPRRAPRTPVGADSARSGVVRQVKDNE